MITSWVLKEKRDERSGQRVRLCASGMWDAVGGMQARGGKAGWQTRRDVLQRPNVLLVRAELATARDPNVVTVHMGRSLHLQRKKI